MIFLESTDLLSQIQFESHYFLGKTNITYFFIFESEVPELGYSVVALPVLSSLAY